MAATPLANVCLGINQYRALMQYRTSTSSSECVLCNKARKERFWFIFCCTNSKYQYL